VGYLELPRAVVHYNKKESTDWFYITY
jgi:hypothetical protein